MILSILFYESSSLPVNEIHDPNKAANTAEMRASSLVGVDGNNQLIQKPRYANPQEIITPLTEDEKLNINKMVKYYQSAMPSQSSELMERYLFDYLRINIPAQKFEEAKKSTLNLIEYEKSLMEIESNYKNINLSEVERKKWLDNLKFDLREKFVQKDGTSLYAVTQ